MGVEFRKKSGHFPPTGGVLSGFVLWLACFSTFIALVLLASTMGRGAPKLAMSARFGTEQSGVRFPVTLELPGIQGRLQAMNVRPLEDNGVALQWHLFSWPNSWFDRFPLTVDQNLSSARGLQREETTYWGGSVRQQGRWGFAYGTCEQSHPATPSSFRIWDLALTRPGLHIGELTVSDSLPDVTHPDLAGVVQLKPREGHQTTPADTHGTHIVGITSALRNGQGVVGVIPGLRVHLNPIEVHFTKNGPRISGESALTALDELHASLVSTRLASLRPPRAILLSWAFLESDGLDSAFIDALEARIRKILEFDVALIVPAGNFESGRFKSSGKVYPAMWANQMADLRGSLLPVGSSDICSQASWFSNLAPNSLGTVLLAPGERIFSTITGHDYGFLSGTSTAAAQVAAVLAMTSARFPDVEMKTQVNTLIRTAVPLPNLEGERLVSFDAPALVQGLMAEFGWIARY